MKIFSICVYNVEKYGSKCVHKSGKNCLLLWCEVKPACPPTKLKKMIFNHLNNVYADFQNQLQYTFVFTEIYVWNSMSTTWQISKRLYIKRLLIFLPNFYAENYW